MRRSLAAAVALVAAPVHAQAPRIVEEMAGTWQALPVDGGTACTIALTTKKAAGESWVAKPAPQCAANVPAAAKIAAWSPMDGVQLLDAQGRVALAFDEDETALFSSPTVADPTLYLIPAITGFTHVPQPRELQGDWTVKRGTASCSIRLHATMVGRTETRALTPSPACAGIPAKLDHWWFEGLTLLLGGPDDLLVRFDPVGDARFKGETSGRDGATIGGWSLVRPPPAPFAPARSPAPAPR